MNRKIKDGIIFALCKYCEETEIPSIFALWTGICTISAALGRRCFIDFGYKNIYPNIYVVLVAQSAGCRKSSAVEQAENLLKTLESKVNLLSQKTTPEALIEALSCRTKIENGNVIHCAEGTAIADELTTLIDRNSAKNGLINLLTKLYDCGDFEYRTRGKGVETIKNPCLTLYGGTTASWIREALTVSAITGGFTSRIVFVYLDKRDRDIYWPTISLENKKRKDRIIEDLHKVSQLEGQFEVTDRAKELFGEEYSKTSALLNDPLTSGYAGRRHVTLLKIAMCINASRTDNMIIEDEDIQVAINALSDAEKDLPRVMQSISSTDVGDICQFVVDLIKKKRVICNS